MAIERKEAFQTLLRGIQDRQKSRRLIRLADSAHWEIGRWKVEDFNSLDLAEMACAAGEEYNLELCEEQFSTVDVLDDIYQLILDGKQAVA